MKLHGNAALSWSGRRRLAERVVVEGWTLRAAAAAAGVSVRCARKWVGRYRELEGERGLRDRSSAPRRVANRTLAGAGGGDHRPAPPALHRRRDRRGARDGALDRLGDPAPGRAWAGSADSGSSSPCATSARARASSCTSTSRSSAGSRAAPAGASAAAPQHYNRTYTDRDGRAPQHRRLRVRARRHRRLQPPRLRRGAARTRRQTTAVGFLRRAVAFYRRHGIRVERVLTDNGSAYLSATHALACRRARHPPPAHPPLPAADERQGRALHPHARSPAGRTARSTARASERTAALDGWLWHYNHRRRHSALGRQPPVSRTNLLGSYT